MFSARAIGVALAMLAGSAQAREAPIQTSASEILLAAGEAKPAADPDSNLATSDGTAAAEPEPHELSANELNQKITNPVGGIWALQSQFNNYRLANGKWNNNWNFQPTLPIALTPDWNLVTRPILPLYDVVPRESSTGQSQHTTGLGDLILSELISPADSGNWILAAGPTFILPTATSEFTGQSKWQAGPGLLVGYLTKDFILGAFPLQWWSVGNNSSRPATSQLNLQPIAAVFFGDGWDIGYSGNVLADWKASSGNIWTVPVGVNVGKVVKFGRLPIKIQFAVQYMVVHPNDVGQEWNFQFQVTPVIPKLFKGALFK